MSEKEKKLNTEAGTEEVTEEVIENATEETAAETSEEQAEEKTSEKADETEKLQKELGELNDKYLRVVAEYQNFRRRTEKEKQDIYAFGNEKIVSDMLNVIDNFERALVTETADEGFKEGMRLIFKQFQDLLAKNGVKEIEALGQEFDPNFHNAVMTEDSTEYDSGCVTQVLQKGYTLNDRVVRPSMVKVAN